MDDFTKKLTNLGQDALKSAKKLKDAAALSIDIVAEEERLKALFVSLGKLYYKHHSDSPEEEMVEACQLIADSQTTLCHKRKQLAVVKGIDTCENCGKEIKNDAVFCPYCGKEVSPKTELCK